MTKDLQPYLAQERERHLEELKEFLKIPSISSSTANAPDMRTAAEWLADALQKAGLENVKVLETKGHPVVYGDWLHAPGRQTALVYGHYDVQPVDPIDQWETQPFEPVIRDGELYARGASDDKGQLYTQIKTVEAFLKTAGSFPLNIKFCLEGEEEIASPNLAPFLEEHAEMLKADLIVISDGPMHEEGVPSICVGLRGICGFEVQVKGPKTELHSGSYGGGVANPAAALIQLLASMRDEDGKVKVEGFYDKVNPLTEKDHQAFREIPFNEEKLRSGIGVPALSGEKGYTYLERTTARPTLEINGIYGGFQGEGLKPIVPASAGAKLSCRLVDRQEPDEIYQLIEDHIRKHTPPGVTVEAKQTHRGKPFVISMDHPFIQAASQAYEAGFGKKPVYIRSGASIPIIEVFSRILGAPVVMMDFGWPGDNIHGPNEHFSLDNFDRGIKTLCSFWTQFEK